MDATSAPMKKGAHTNYFIAARRSRIVGVVPHVDLTREDSMTKLGKVMTAMVIGLSTSMLAPTAASAALSASTTAQCAAQVRAMWPH